MARRPASSSTILPPSRSTRSYVEGGVDVGAPLGFTVIGIGSEGSYVSAGAAAMLGAAGRSG